MIAGSMPYSKNISVWFRTSFSFANSIYDHIFTSKPKEKPFLFLNLCYFYELSVNLTKIK
jgi:hypothetical protein